MHHGKATRNRRHSQAVIANRSKQMPWENNHENIHLKSQELHHAWITDKAYGEMFIRGCLSIKKNIKLITWCKWMNCMNGIWISAVKIRQQYTDTEQTQIWESQGFVVLWHYFTKNVILYITDIFNLIL